MQPLRVLIACEQSGVMRRAFAARGHDAWSCDLLPAEDGAGIEGFPAYVITSLGRVLSFHKGVPIALAQSPDGKGYMGVNLRHDGSGGSFRVHRLVAAAFVANPLGLPVVRHLDGNPANNCAVNLAWGTYADNEADKMAHGTWDTRRTGKLSREDRQLIRDLTAEGWSQKALADLFDVSRPTITRLLNGSIWGNDRTFEGVADAAADQWGGYTMGVANA